MRSLFVQLPNFDMLVRCYTPGEVQQVDHSDKVSVLQDQVTRTVGNAKDAIEGDQKQELPDRQNGQDGASFDH